MKKSEISPLAVMVRLGSLLFLSEALVMSTILGFDLVPGSPWLRALLDIAAVCVIVLPVLCFWVGRNFGMDFQQLRDLILKTATVIFCAEGGLMMTIELVPFIATNWAGVLSDTAGFTAMAAIAIYSWALKPIIEKTDDQSMSVLTSVTLAGLVAYAILVLDVSLPLGIAGGVPYVALVLVGLWFPHRHAVVILAVAATVLTLVGYFISPPGGIFWVVATNRALAIFAIWVTAFLASEFKSDHAQLQKSEADLENAQRIGRLGNWEWDIKAGTQWWSDEIYRLIGQDPKTYEPSFDNYLAAVRFDDRFRVAKAVRQALKEGKFSVEYAVTMPDGSVKHVSAQAEVTFGPAGEAILMCGTIHDITERIEIENKLKHLANHDTLTGLPTRNLTVDRILRKTANGRRYKTKVAVLFIDLDGFKKINDTLGHEAGDQVLIETAARLSSSVREADTVARFGGDEFIIVLGDAKDRASITIVAEKVIEAVSRPYKLGNKEATIGASIGIAIYPDQGEDPEELLRRADHAMYAIKRTGKNHYGFAEDLDPEIEFKWQLHS